MPLIPPKLNGAVAVATNVLRHVPFGPRLVTSAFVSLLANAHPAAAPAVHARRRLHELDQPDRPVLHRPPPARRPPRTRSLPTEAEVLDLFRRPPGEGDAVGRHQRAVPALRPVVHRQLPAHRPHRLAEEHLDPGDRLLPDLRAVGGEDPPAAVDGGRPAEVAADRRPGVPAVPLRAHGERRGTRSSPSSRACTTRAGCSTSSSRASPTSRRTSSSRSGSSTATPPSGSTALDVLFLREHNRIAGLLAREYDHGREHPVWDRRMTAADLDERLFQTTRLIMIVLLLKLVVEEYIRHIAPYDPPLTVVPGLAAKKRVEPVQLDRGRVRPALPVAHAGSRPGDHRRRAGRTPRPSCATTTSSSSTAGSEWVMAQC